MCKPSDVIEANPSLSDSGSCKNENKSVGEICIGGNNNMFLSKGYVFSCGVRNVLTILHDCGVLQSLMLEGLVPMGESEK